LLSTQVLNLAIVVGLEFADEPTPSDEFLAPGTEGFGDGST